MSKPILDVIVVGAGHAGISVSYYLAKQGVSHLVFEKGQIGETWRSQRWDSFKMNSANRLNLLPQQATYFDDPDAFAGATEFALALESYAHQENLPVKEYCPVVSVHTDQQRGVFRVTVSEQGKDTAYLSRRLVIASGSQNRIWVPDWANHLAQPVVQLHASQYKNAHQLPAGNVLVVGSGQSGTQIAQDLLRSGRHVFLSTARVGRIPRRYRGKDIFDWLVTIGFYNTLTEEVTDPSLLTVKNPQVSGAGQRGKTSSLQSLARSGAIILGRADRADADTIFFQPNSSANVRYADEFSQQVKQRIDEYIQKNKVLAPLADIDLDDVPDEEAACASDLTQLNLVQETITSIIWTTGFRGDFSYLPLPVLNEERFPKHRNGIGAVEGLYFIGLPWLRKRQSAIILGIKEDAEFIVSHIVKSGLPGRG
ncbi:putative czcO-like oxidoreductase [Fibrella aestuarina BUZ 2]|uniref:Putative czcO-like oxidoreductase n=1 Tax=Fibrella aestuarina BUZ 2 TaxID=1166018 RepID=I0K2M9_9BACT|nr:NAD(P)/FAD-dependent oxidoreductase [Fibrella aestuarina]CCG98382.1 putative czcO-like oxidoreductase [Fibrella aestuarina BUZ 2]